MKVIQHVLSLGRSCLLAKIDIESPFRNIPVHLHDRHLLGMLWNDQLFVDTVLPFGLRSTPKIFNCIADALQRTVKLHSVSYLENFLNDFIIAGAPESNKCDQNQSVLISTCNTLGLPMALDKCEGPSFPWDRDRYRDIERYIEIDIYIYR